MSVFKFDVAKSAVISGFVGVTVPYPFDVVRTRQQANVMSESQVSRALVRLWKTLGVRSFYKGWSCSISFYVPASVVYYLTYESSRKALCSRVSCGESFLEAVSGFSAMTAGLMLWTPMDNIAQKCQCGPTSQTPRRVLCSILQTEGISGLYRGMSASVLSNGPQCALFWALYESTKRGLSKLTNKDSTQTQLASAMFSSWASVVLTNPIDVVRCQIQTDQVGGKISKAASKSTWDGFKLVFKNEGFRSLVSKGLRARCMVVIPDYVLGIMSFETAFTAITGHTRD